MTEETNQPSQPIDPRLESVVGVNFPYRGTELHGVESPEPPLPVEKWESGTEVEYREPEREPDPVPVRIVSAGAREYRDWRIVKLDTTSTPRMILGRDLKRNKAVLKNTTATTVYISHDTSVDANFGFPMEENAEVTLTTQAPVYAMSATDTFLNGYMEFSKEV